MSEAFAGGDIGTKQEWQKLYILEARTGAGDLISNSSTADKAVNFTILINKDNASEFYQYLDSGKIELANVTELVHNGTFAYEENTIEDLIIESPFIEEVAEMDAEEEEETEE